MSMTIRPAATSDRAFVLALAHRLEEGVAVWRDPSSVAAAVRRWVEGSLDSLNEPDQAVFIAELEGDVVGFISVSEHKHWAGDRDAYISELVVSAAVEGQGIGSALVRAAIDWGRSRGHPRISVSTGAANLSARRFYAAIGFDEEDITLSFTL